MGGQKDSLSCLLIGYCRCLLLLLIAITHNAEGSVGRLLLSLVAITHDAKGTAGRLLGLPVAIV